jgi:hypothetical protein
MRWQDIIKLDDNALQAKGVAALGARRKMLKVFENVRDHCHANVSLYVQYFSVHITNIFLLRILNIKPPFLYI